MKKMKLSKAIRSDKIKIPKNWPKKFEEIFLGREDLGDWKIEYRDSEYHAIIWLPDVDESTARVMFHCLFANFIKVSPKGKKYINKFNEPKLWNKAIGFREWLNGDKYRS